MTTAPFLKEKELKITMKTNKKVINSDVEEINIKSIKED